jgi:hypothetical protein
MGHCGVSWGRGLHVVRVGLDRVIDHVQAVEDEAWRDFSVGFRVKVAIDGGVAGFICRTDFVVIVKEVQVGSAHISPLGTPLYVTNQTNSLEQSHSWKANSHSGGREIPPLLGNMKVHYHVHKSPPLVHILIQMNIAHVVTLFLYDPF